MARVQKAINQRRDQGCGAIDDNLDTLSIASNGVRSSHICTCLGPEVMLRRDVHPPSSLTEKSKSRYAKLVDEMHR